MQHIPLAAKLSIRSPIPNSWRWTPRARKCLRKMGGYYEPSKRLMGVMGSMRMMIVLAIGKPWSSHKSHSSHSSHQSPCQRPINRAPTSELKIISQQHHTQIIEKTSFFRWFFPVCFVWRHWRCSMSNS